MITVTLLTLVLFRTICAEPIDLQNDKVLVEQIHNNKTELTTPFAISVRHGGNGGTSFRFECPYDGAITGVNYRSGQRVDQLQFICTSFMGRTTFGPYGGGGGSAGSVICPQQHYISSIYGRGGLGLDRLGLRCRHQSDMTAHGQDAGEFGGNGGEPFNDVALSVGARPIAITVRGGNVVDGLDISYWNVPLTPLCTDCSQYREEWAPKHGGDGGGMKAFVCPMEGVIIGIKYRSGQRFDSIQFTCLSTLGETTIGPFGSNGGSGPFDDKCDPGFYISSIHGRSSNTIDMFGIRCVRRGQIGSSPSRHGHGGDGGEPFDDENFALRGQRPVEIRIWSGAQVDAVQVKYGNMPVEFIY